MATTRVRDQEGYVRFLYYLDETGLDVELRAICLRHHVTPKDVYLDTKGPTVHAARLEIWWWLTSTIGKSTGEVARIFDRDGSSVLYAIKRLRETAASMTVELDAMRVPDVARDVALTAASSQRRNGQTVAVFNRRAIKP